MKEYSPFLLDQVKTGAPMLVVVKLLFGFSRKIGQSGGRFKCRYVTYDILDESTIPEGRFSTYLVRL